MSLLEKVQSGIITAMKSRDELTLNTLRSIKSALERYRVDVRKPIDEKVEQAILKTQVKQRQEAADAFRKGNRPESWRKELDELAIIEAFMPQFATEEDVEAALYQAFHSTGANSMKQAGLVMKAAQANLSGKRVDAKVLMDTIKARLGA